MSKAEFKLLLGLESPEVEPVVEGVVGELGWELERRDVDAFVVHEDLARLHCHCSPLRAELDLKAAGSGRTELTIRGQVAGWGPVSSQHAREQTELLARRLDLAVTRASGGRHLG